MLNPQMGNLIKDSMRVKLLFLLKNLKKIQEILSPGFVTFSDFVLSNVIQRTHPLNI